MIISHKHKFIFIKTRKTAGSSIELFLSQFCGPKDILTPLIPEEEKIREKQNIVPQKYFEAGILPKILTLMRKSSKPIHPYLAKSSSLRILTKKTHPTFREHMTAHDIRELVGEDVWNSYYKFCFDRNPWDKTVSSYFWDKHDLNLGDMAFNDYLETETGKNLRWYNYPLYTYQNKIIVDFIGKYENLKDDFTKICKKIGIEFNGELPRAKTNFRPKQHHYSYYFNDKNRELIRDHFKKEIDLNGYIFEKREN